MTLDEFIQNTKFFPNSAWVKEIGFSGLYVRKTQRVLDGMLYNNVLDLANISASKPGNGAFTKLVERLCKEYPHLTLYVENVMEPERFGRKLIELGFKRVESEYSYQESEHCNSYWKESVPPSILSDEETGEYLKEMGIK
jgi:hypothetical protein